MSGENNKFTLADIAVCKVVATLPKGTLIDQVVTDDPLEQKFLFEQPDGVFKTLSIGPNGVEILEVAMTPDFTIGISSTGD